MSGRSRSSALRNRDRNSKERTITLIWRSRRGSSEGAIFEVVIQVWVG